jgi:hypothetical protein
MATVTTRLLGFLAISFGGSLTIATASCGTANPPTVTLPFKESFLPEQPAEPTDYSSHRNALFSSAIPFSGYQRPWAKIFFWGVQASICS